MTDIWQTALCDLKAKVSAHNFDAWFRNIRFHHQQDLTVYLEVSDDFFKAWIEDNYLDLIEDALRSTTGARIEVVIDVEGAFDAISEAFDAVIDLEERPVAARMARIARVSQDDTQGSLFPERVELVPLGGAEIGANPVIRATLSREEELQRRIQAAGLNPRYTFEEYVVGPSNQFTHAACAAVASKPAQSYNPLFVFGGVGLGKTHLLQAVGIEILRNNPAARVLNLSSEHFMNQLITSLRNKDMNSFRMQFRNNCDVLLVDDIQFIGGKDSTQEEFFHTFNALHQGGKQIVVTSDKPPKELPGIEERLASRFAWGLIADIQPPEIETRLAILEKKAEADGISLSKEVGMLLASSIRTNVRELEGTLIRLGAQALLVGSPLTLDFARQMLKRMHVEQGRQVNVEQIIRVVAAHFDLKAADIKGARRTRNISEPRQIAMYLARKHTSDSFPELGRKFGGKDHTTVLAACRKIEGLVQDEDDQLIALIDELEALLIR
ncbi:MAG: chromosomal replication initiator protein DnaA [Bradymonadaceae bacterium]|nr:chromosomal replication initiator protein DnaA [Lujinxingiaceae bacterium]